MGCLIKSIKNKVGIKKIVFTKIEKAIKIDRKNKKKHRVEIASK